MQIEEQLERDKQNVRNQTVNNVKGYINQLASINDEANDLQKAAYLVSRGIAVAEVFQNTAIANAKAVAAFPLTAGQPWVGINTASAAISIAGILAQTVEGFKTGVIDYQGKGTETSDSNLVAISKGESVIKASSTRNSKSLLEGINKGNITDDVIPTLTGIHKLEKQQQNIIFDTQRMENKLNNIENLLANQMYVLPDNYKLMDRKFNKINIH